MNTAGQAIDNLHWEELAESTRSGWDRLIRRTRIPSLFTGQSRGLENLQSSDGAELRERISRDPLLSAKLLMVANSTASGKLNPIRSIDKAVNQLGMDLVISVLLTYEIENDLQDGTAVSRSLLLHIRNLASLSRALSGLFCRELKLPDADAFCNAALLGSVATLLLAQTAQFDEELYLSFPDEQQRLLHEHETWGIYSPMITGRMISSWGLAAPLPELVGSRHLPLLGGLDPELPAIRARQICLLAAVNALSQAYIIRQSVTPEILFNRRSYRRLKDNLLEHGMYVAIGRSWGQRSTEHLLRAAY